MGARAKLRLGQSLPAVSDLQTDRVAVDSSTAAHISFQGISKAFHDNGRSASSAYAVRDFSLDIGRGEIFGIIGRSGAGKSTLVRLVNGLELPTSGSVLIDGINISALKGVALRQMRRRIGMIFQSFNLLSSRTVFGNVSLPLELIGTGRAQIKEKVGRLIEMVGLEHKRDAYPAALSGGQKQRVAIARALATDPEILLSDEATSALDPETTESILTLLKRINATLGLTILMITHEMSVIRQACDRVGVLNEGQLIECGNVVDVFAEPAADLTKKLISPTMGAIVPEWLVKRLVPASEGKDALVAITLKGDSAHRPVIAQAARATGVDYPIVAGQVMRVGEHPFAFFTLKVPDKSLNLEQLGAYLSVNNIPFKVVGYV